MWLNFCRLFKAESKEHTFSETEEMRSRLEYLQSRLEKTRQLFDAKERNITISYCDRI